MYHGRDTGAFELPGDELSASSPDRMEMDRIGDAVPINIKLTFACTALPTELQAGDLRHSDAPSRADYYRSLARSHRSRPDPPLAHR